MNDNSNTKKKAGDKGGKAGSDALKESLETRKTDSAAKAAQKKEKQPANAEDLSPLHNTHEVGTAGGDQRAPDREVTDR